MKARTALLLGVLALFLLPGLASTGPTFSRSRWIAERAGKLPFSAGSVPADEAAVEAFFAAVSSVPAPAKPPRLRDFRVSFDILPPDDSVAQPETQAEPFLAVNPERETNLLAGYQEGRFADGGARALTFAVSTDGGRKWREGLIPGLSYASGGPFERASDPWVAFGPGGRAYYASLLFDETTPRNGIFVSASPDGGRTWGDPVAVHTTTSEADDKQSMTVDTRADSPFRGRVYVGWDSVTADNRQILRFAYSADDGASFSRPVTIEDVGANIGIIPLVGPGGVVYAIWSHADLANGLGISIARSEDGGETWSEGVQIASQQFAEVEGMRTGAVLPAAAIDPLNGALYVVWQDARFTPGVDQVLLTVSTDGGENWSEPRRISDGPADAPSFTASVAVNGRGRVAVIYSSLRNDPERRFLADAYLAVSVNQGQTFRPAIRLSSAVSDVRFASFARGFFLGDYQGLAAGRDLFHTLWVGTLASSRRNPPARQPDVFLRTIRP